MDWTFMVIVLWLANGLPEPHTAAFPQNIECTADMAKEVWDHYVSEHADGEVTLRYGWVCEHDKAPEKDAAPELPPGHPDISKPEPHEPSKDEA